MLTIIPVCAVAGPFTPLPSALAVTVAEEHGLSTQFRATGPTTNGGCCFAGVCAWADRLTTTKGKEKNFMADPPRSGPPGLPIIASNAFLLYHVVSQYFPRDRVPDRRS